MVVATGANAALYLLREASYGDPAVGNYIQMPFSSVNLAAKQPLEADDTLGMGRMPQRAIRGLITANGQATVPVDQRLIGQWLTLLCGPPVTTHVTATATLEGWQAWEAHRITGLTWIQVGDAALATLNVSAVIGVATALGYDTAAVAALAPSLAAGVLAARDGPTDED
ncbi:hypothetical protein WCLP8_1880007 [uncultured Gammaproteobacteria bacterium]